MAHQEETVQYQKQQGLFTSRQLDMSQQTKDKNFMNMCSYPERGTSLQTQFVVLFKSLHSLARRDDKSFACCHRKPEQTEFVPTFFSSFFLAQREGTIFVLFLYCIVIVLYCFCIVLLCLLCFIMTFKKIGLLIYLVQRKEPENNWWID